MTKPSFIKHHYGVFPVKKHIEAPFVRSPYNYDVNEASDASGLKCPEPTLTQQQYAEESDINFIADRYGLTGEVPTVLQLPKYGDFSGIYDFQSANNAVIEARRQFMTLPAKLRARFENEPQRLLSFLEDPENREEAIFLGLVNKPDDAPQSLQDDAAAKGDRANPAPDPDAAAKSAKADKKDPPTSKKAPQ